MIIPVKAVKGECQEIRNRDKAPNDLYSTAVLRIRQPVKSLFNWLIEKTNIQRACKVRSTKGLLPQSVWQDCSCLYKLNILTLYSRN